MKNDPIIDKLLEDPAIRNLGLKGSVLSTIVNKYSDVALNQLLENGYVSLANGMFIEVVQLTDRVHVLRGVSYPSSRKYKLKLSMDGNLYEKIETYYDNLREEIK